MGEDLQDSKHEIVTLEDNILVVDLGSRTIYAGLSSNLTPPHCFPSVVGHCKHPFIFPSIFGKSFLVGEFALSRRGIFNLKWPIQKGIVTNWEEMERIWRYMFYEKLKIDDPTQYAVVVTEPVLNPATCREKTAELLFETFGVKGFYIVVREVMSLFEAGKGTGIVLSLGSETIRAVPVIESYVIPVGVLNLDFGGERLTTFLVDLLEQRGYRTYTSVEKLIVQDIKEGMCAVSLDYEADRDGKVHDTHVYDLPPGIPIDLNREVSQVPEALFQPVLLGEAVPGVHELVSQSLLACDKSRQKELASSIVLRGGSSKFPNFKERLTKELTTLLPDFPGLTVHIPKDRARSSWLGAALLASIPEFEQRLITKEEYELDGPKAVYKLNWK